MHYIRVKFNMNIITLDYFQNKKRRNRKKTEPIVKCDLRI